MRAFKLISVISAVFALGACSLDIRIGGVSRGIPSDSGLAESAMLTPEGNWRLVGGKTDGGQVSNVSNAVYRFETNDEFLTSTLVTNFTFTNESTSSVFVVTQMITVNGRWTLTSSNVVTVVETDFDFTQIMAVYEAAVSNGQAVSVITQRNRKNRPSTNSYHYRQTNDNLVLSPTNRHENDDYREFDRD